MEEEEPPRPDSTASIEASIEFMDVKEEEDAAEPRPDTMVSTVIVI